MATCRIEGSAFVLVSSGYADGPNQSLIKYLGERGAASVTSILHPLVPEGEPEHRVERYVGGALVDTRTRRRPNRPPFTYGFDPITPLLPPKADVWIGYNCIATAQGLVHRRLGRVRHVVHWNIDYVPKRFGDSRLTGVYEWLDERCCRRSDGRVELSPQNRDGRLASYGMDDSSTPCAIIPMGSWTRESPRCSTDNLAAPRAIFVGHLVERMGAEVFVDAIAATRDRGRPLAADLVGGGPLLDDIRARVTALQLDDLITVHGFVPEFEDVKRLLAGAAVACAPYDTSESSFSRFADSGKLKAYLGAALPIVLTDVTPNARDIAQNGGGQLVADDADAFADAVLALVADRDEWVRRHDAARAYVEAYDWNTLFDTNLPTVGIQP